MFPLLSCTTEGECGFVLCEMRQCSLCCHVQLRVNGALLVLCEMRQCSLRCHVQLRVNVALLVHCEMGQCAVMYS